MIFNINSRRLSHPQNIIVQIPRNIKQVTVTWDKIINPDIDKSSGIYINSVTYNVYRGTSVNGIFYKINNVVLNTNRYDDNTVGLNPNTIYWYKVSTVANFSDGSNSESELSEAVRHEVRNENKWFKKMNERNMWILKNTGVLMDLYIRKTEGERCNDCYDPVRGQAQNSKCPICYGTTFVGGYDPAIQIYVRQKPAQQQMDLTSQGYVLNSSPGAWTISNTHIHNRDLLINPEGRIFSITASTVTHAAGYYFHQELQMKEIDPLDPKYDMKRKNLYPEF